MSLSIAWGTPTLRNGLILLCASLFAAFLIIPHLSAILQFNFNVPFSQLGHFYALGGLATMVLTILTGKLLTRFSSVTLLVISSLISLCVLWSGFVFLWLAPVAVFVAFMSVNGSRNLIVQTHLSHLPLAHQRAGYMAILTTIRNVATALAAFISSQILVSNGQLPLDNVSILIAIGSAFIILTPLLLACHTQKELSNEA